MAISGAGGWPPSVRVSIRNKELRQGICHNVPPEVAKTAEQAAAILIADPKDMPYVLKEELSELWYRLYLADLIEPLNRTYSIKENLP